MVRTLIPHSESIDHVPSCLVVRRFKSFCFGLILAIESSPGFVDASKPQNGALVSVCFWPKTDSAERQLPARSRSLSLG